MTGGLLVLYSLIILISLTIILTILYGNKQQKTSADRILAINKVVLGAVIIIFIIGIILVYAYYADLGHRHLMP